MAIAIGLSVQGSRSALMLLLLMVNGVVTLAGLLVLKIEPSEFLTRWPVFTSDVKMFPYGSTATLCRAVKCGCKGRPTAITI